MPGRKIPDDKIGPLRIPLVPPGMDIPAPDVIEKIIRQRKEKHRGDRRPTMEIPEYPTDAPEQGPPNDGGYRGR
jgi:hypothetical protein